MQRDKKPTSPYLTMESSGVRCPFCLKHELLEKHDLLCANCNNDKLETIKNSTLENESLNDRNRNDINDIFEFSNRIRKGLSKGLTRDNDVSVPLNSVKQLSLQLLKRELINQTIKIHNIEKSKASLQSKVIYLNENIVNIEQDTASVKTKINTKSRELLNKYQRDITKINADISDFRNERITQIEKQSIQHQQANFRILKELAFNSRNNSYIPKIRDSSYVLLFNQPIIKINDFFEYNNKLFQLNGFIENLIKLQIQLEKVLDHDGIKLPYLDELIKYLPDTNFYDLVQQKENFMLNGGKIVDDSFDEVDIDNSDSVPSVDNNDTRDTERVVKLGNTIKLPLSSKTINSQLRRASMARPVLPLLPLSEDTASSRDATPENGTEQPEKSPTNPTSVNRPQLKSNLSGKKVVIVPHKILTKPFTKLTSKEYLTFLLIIVKILVNFKVLFVCTLDIIPKNQNMFSNTLSHTINQFRTGMLMGNDKDLSGYNFDKIIHKVMYMNDFFEFKLNSLQENKKSKSCQDQGLSSHVSLASSLQSKGSISPSLTTESFTQTYSKPDLLESGSLLQAPETYKPKKKVSSDGLQTLYTDLFKGSVTKPSQTRSKLDTNIYGHFSETSGTEGGQSGRSSPKPVAEYTNINADTVSNNSSNNEKIDLKLIMEEVHHLMINGSARATNNHRSVFKTHSLNTSTLNMIAQSKIQLDEWDVVSKMYQ